MLLKTIVNYLFLIPHLIIYRCLSVDVKALVDSDVLEMNKRLNKSKTLIYYLSDHKPYRNLFYYRVGSRKARLLKFFLREYPMFVISPSCKYIGRNAFVLNHPYGTIIHAESIGDNFTCCQLTTIGNKNHGQNQSVPIIGNNVSLGANVTIIGKICIGDNVTIGAGSVVVKNVPSNSVVVGNPGKIVLSK